MANDLHSYKALWNKYRFFSKVATMPWVQKIILFGSRARGEGHDRSDIDIAIVAPTASDQEWFQLLDLLDQADTLLKIDCIRYDKLENSDAIRQAIDRDGYVLYEQGKNLHERSK